MSDDLLERVRARARDNSFWRYLGVEVVEASEGKVRLRVPVRDELRNAAGAPVHGGVYAALTDMAVGGALATMHEASAGGVGQTTLDMNVSFIGASTGDVFAEGRILRRGPDHRVRRGHHHRRGGQARGRRPRHVHDHRGEVGQPSPLARERE